MDDLLPNDGSTFDPTLPPEDQVKEENAYVAKAESSYPVIEDLIKDIEDDIKKADSISGQGLYELAEQSPQQAQVRFEANRLYVEKLKEKLEVLRRMRDVVKR